MGVVFWSAAAAVLSCWSSHAVLAEGYCLNSYDESKLRYLNYKGQPYPFVITYGSGSSPEPISQVVKILLVERLGVKTALRGGLENLHTTYEVVADVAGCHTATNCDQRKDPPDGWGVVEVFSDSDAVRTLLEYVDLIGPIGYTVSSGLHMYDYVHERAEKDGFTLSWWTNLLRPAANQYFSAVAEVDAALRSLQVEPLCIEGTEDVSILEQEDGGLYQCTGGGWFIAPACREDNSTCIPVLLTEFDWHVVEYIRGAVEHDLPFAITWLGYANLFLRAVPELYNSNITFLFHWDRLTEPYKYPRMVWFDENARPPMLTLKQVQAPDTVLWKEMYKVDREIYDFWRRMSFPDDAIDYILNAKSAGASSYEAACMWLKNDTVWEDWFKDETFCYNEGHFFNASAGECQACAPGKIAPEFGMTACEDCQPGEYVSQAGRSQCQICARGHFSGAGASECEPCQGGPGVKGFYQPEEGQDACIPCPDPLETRFPGRIEAYECNCPAGTAKTNEGRCTACREELGGIECPFASSAEPCDSAAETCLEVHPNILEGYYSTGDDPLVVYECAQTSHCPGKRIPGECALNREGLACARCVEGHSLFLGGDCVRCEGSGGEALVIFSMIAGLGCCTFIHAFVNTPANKAKRNSLTLIAFLGMMVTSVLMFNVYSRLSTNFESPLSSVFGAVSIMAFNTEFFRLACLTGTDSFLIRYLTKLAVVPLGFLGVVAGALVLRASHRTRKYSQLQVATIVNSCGLLFSVFFIAVTVMSLEIFQCVEHPSGGQGKESLQIDHSVICWTTTEHEMLMAFGIFAILIYPVLFLALTGWISLKFGYFNNTLGHSFHRATRFFFNRMNPELHHSAFFYNVRNFLLCLCPVLSSSDFPMQIFLLTILWLAWMLVLMYCEPWRFPELNRLDSFTTVVHILILTLMGTSADWESTTTQADNGEARLGWLIVCIFCISLVVLAVGAGTSLYRHLTKRRKFRYFIMHHQAAYGLLVRRVKLLLEEYSSGRVFVDVDQIESLDNVAFIVRTDVEYLLVFLTEDMLQRFPCALEITLAWLNKVPMVVVRQSTVDGPALSERFLDSISKRWTDAELCGFRRYGVSSEDVEKACRYLVDLPSFSLPVDASDATLRTTVKSVIAQTGGDISAKAYQQDDDKVLHLIYDTRDRRQECHAQVLCTFFNQSRWTTHILSSAQQAELRAPQLVIVLISSGLVDNALCLGFLTKAMNEGTPFMTVLSHSEASSPRKTMYMGFQIEPSDPLQEEETWNVITSIAPGCHREQASGAIEQVCKTTPWHFDPHEPEAVLRAECASISSRAWQTWQPAEVPQHPQQRQPRPAEVDNLKPAEEEEQEQFELTSSRCSL